MVTLTALEKRYGIAFEERKLPDPEEARRRWAERHIAEVKEAMRSSVFEAMVPLAQDVKALPDGDQLFAFLLRYFFTHRRVERLAEQDKTDSRTEAKPRERAERGGRREREERPSRRDRDERRERPARDKDDGKSAEAPSPEPEVDPRGAKLWCNLGAADKLDESGIGDAVALLAGIERSRIHAVELKGASTFLFVEPEACQALLDASGKEREGKKVRVERPRPRR